MSQQQFYATVQRQEEYESEFGRAATPDCGTKGESIMQFQRAVRKRAKLRLALTGPSGSGKTYSALLLAKGLGGRIAVIDTENSSAELYADICDFDACTLTPPYTPERYIEALKAAEVAAYDVIIIDSTTHEWSGSGGCLELNDQIAKSKFQGNTWSAWSVTTPRHRAFLDAMMQSPAHIIATGRSKTETAQTEGPNGKKKVVKLGMKTEQKDGFEYEFTAVLDLIHDGNIATASKDRTGLFMGDAVPVSEATGVALREWLESGADALLLEMRAAALEGTDSLHAAHSRHKSSAGFGEWWAKHKPELVAAASLADEPPPPDGDIES